jgi:hypothetical protein
VIEVKELVPWLSLALALVSIALPYITGRSREVDRKIDSKADALQVGALAGKLDLVEDRVTIVESDLKHLPDKETTHRLEMSLGDLRSEVRGLSEKMKPIAAIADRVQDAVMEKVMGK